MAISIPPKNRPEWQQMLTGEIECKYKNYVLQAQIHQLRKDISSKKITIYNATSELYKLCEKYALAVQLDVKQIFKTW